MNYKVIQKTNLNDMETVLTPLFQAGWRLLGPVQIATDAFRHYYLATLTKET